MPTPKEQEDLRRQEQDSLARLHPKLRSSLLSSVGVSTAEAAKAEEPSLSQAPEEAIPSPAQAEPKNESMSTPTAAADPLPEVNLTEKLAFYNASLGGPPFQKSYSAFDGRFSITFRQIPRRYEIMAGAQAKLDTFGQLDDSFLGPWMDYRFLLSIVSISTVSDLLNLGAELDQHLAAVDAKRMREESILNDVLVEVSSKTLLSNTSVWKMCYKYWNQFTSLVAYLETKVDDVSFWRGIGG
jgi:hypothetical protein